MLLTLMSIDDVAFCPDDGYPRLIRFDLPDAGTGCVAQLDREYNLLRVCKRIYDDIGPTQQHIVLKTLKEKLYRSDLPT